MKYPFRKIVGFVVGLSWAGIAQATDTVWVEDSLPNGAGGIGAGDGDAWNWISGNPTPYSGSLAHKSNNVSGYHSHWWGWGDGMTVATGDTLFVYVYLDPVTPPSELMVMWSTSTSWEHRAYWGSNQITLGTDGTTSRYYVGPLPATGGWYRLEVPASAVGMEGETATAMNFALFDGVVTWDRAGKSTGSSPPPEQVWVEDSLPNGAGGIGAGDGDAWNWIGSNPAPYSGSLAHKSNNVAGYHSHWWGWGDGMTVATGDTLFVYVYLDPVTPPSELMVMWSTSTSWEHRAYWGSNQITLGTDGTASRYYIGPLPATGGWYRLEVPASAVGMEGQTATAMNFALYDGVVTWDRAGKLPGGGGSGDPPASAPTFSPVAGTYSSAQSVVISSSTSGATIYYTLDGSAPTHASSVYSAPISIGSDTTLKAIAWASGYSDSEPSTAEYVIGGSSSVPPPIFDLPAGSYPAFQLLRISSTASGAAIYYTTDGTTPSPSNGTLYSTPIGIGNGTLMLKAVAIVNSQSSRATTATFAIPGAPGSEVDYTLLKVPAVGASALHVLTPRILELKLINSLSQGQIAASATNRDQPLAQPARWGSWFSDSAQPDGQGGYNYTISFAPPSASTFPVTINGQSVSATFLGFKRRPLYAPFNRIDLRIENSLYLKLPSALNNGDAVQVTDTTVSAPPMSATVDPYRYSPAIHVNQEGYVTTLSLEPASPHYAPKRAMVGYYMGSAGETTNQEELDISPYAQFYIVQLTPNQAPTWVYPSAGTTKAMTARPELGYDSPHGTYGTLPPYQNVYEANFDDLITPGVYQLVVPGLGASLPFRINDGIFTSFARTYALGLYHQRCGAANALPFTRFTHAACHTAWAAIPWPSTSGTPAYSGNWDWIESETSHVPAHDTGWDLPVQTAVRITRDPATHFTELPTAAFTHTIYDDHPELRNDGHPDYKSNTSGDARPDVNVELYQFANGLGTVNVNGGHHDAGDYSKYTINCADLVHFGIFTVDAIPGGLADNLGIPESGDNISDVLQEAKWEADYISRLQDPSDGGFYFIVYPRNPASEYESGPPDNSTGNGQIIWPKNTSATAAAIGALAQCASSSEFQTRYGNDAKKYTRQAKAGWWFLKNQFAAHDEQGSYQALTFYGDHWIHNDEIAWAAVELYLLTKETEYRDAILHWMPNPAETTHKRYGNIRMSEKWGNAMRSLAFAVKTGRITEAQLNADLGASYVQACKDEVLAAADDAVTASKGAARNAYGTSVSPTVKNQRNTGWYFSVDHASDVAAGYALVDSSNTTKRIDYLETLIANLNYEAGCNPVNVSFVAGLGQRRQQEIISQYANSDQRVLPPTGIPIGNLGTYYEYYANAYGSALQRLTFPYDFGTRPYAFYDRWTDTFNTQNEWITVNMARSLMACLLLSSGTASSAWKPADESAALSVSLTPATATSPANLQVSSSNPSLDMSEARVVWEAENSGAAFGSKFDLIGKAVAARWFETEVAWPDGRRLALRGSLTPTVISPEIWMDDALPAGADSQDTWNWIQTGPTPFSGLRAHQTPNGSGPNSRKFSDPAQLSVGPGDVLFVYVYLDPATPPREIALSWRLTNNGQDDYHSAWWGENLLVDQPGPVAMGGLPSAGQWVRLEVRATEDLGITSPRPVLAMWFKNYDGKITWDVAGKYSPNP